MRTIEERNCLVVEHKYIADKIAYRRKKSCIKSIQLSELKSAAYMGLIDAANKFDENKGSFKTYAKYRIYGEINDYLRKFGTGRRNRSIKLWSLDVPVCTNNFNNASPLEDNLRFNDPGLTQVDNNDAFRELISCLSSIQKKVMYLYYIRGINMKEIGHKIGFCESYVSQIAAEARSIIRDKYEDQSEEIFTIQYKKGFNFFSNTKEIQ